MVGDKEGREIEVSFSSEAPVETYWGTEYLDHADGAIDLQRLLNTGIALFNHDRDAVIGVPARVWVENGRGRAVLRFATTEFAESIRQLVEDGVLRGVSVGYMVDVWEEVKSDAVSTDGRFPGPCSIARSWWPFEISLVTVPADATVGVGRSFNAAPHALTQPSLRMNENMYLYYRNLMAGGHEHEH